MSERADAAASLPVNRSYLGQSSAGGALVLSLGNPLRGDDGVGCAALRELSCDSRLPKGAALLDCYRGGLMTALLSGKYERVIIVDAALLGCLPGTWKRFTLGEARLATIDLAACQTLHNVSLAEAVALAETLAIPLPEIIIYGVQPLQIAWSLGLSETLQSIIPEVCTAILKDLEDHRAKNCQDLNSGLQ
ncbi:MAG: hydrogenase maturation protease [Anaerolineales bacterium]|nr:hydrogenase maturation protease [Anaerolineales bacterium]